MRRTPLVVGNWKMHGTLAEASSLAGAVEKELKTTPSVATVVLAPPASALVVVQQTIRGTKIELAGQNCHWQQSGAFTGEISPGMLRDAGCSFVLVGHSERRHIFGENDDIVAKKLRAALKTNLRPILCIGETLEERENGATTTVITRQLRNALKELLENDIGNIEIAYEPVWAIGTGRNADAEQVTEVHESIRGFLTTSFGESNGQGLRLLYGGSVKPENAAELANIPDVDGLLVGGASLKAETFMPVVYCFG